MYYDSNGNGFENVTHYLAEECKKWNPHSLGNLAFLNNLVFIESPTGAGKSFFIYNYLSDYARGLKYNILYLVNRKVLKEQIQEQVSNHVRELSIAYPYSQWYENINVMSYQQLEEMIENSSMIQVVNYLSYNYQYIVADEAHYFLQDSTYNVKTILSFEAVRQASIPTKIFMSATLEDIKEVIENLVSVKKFNRWMAPEASQDPIIWNYALHKKDEYIRPRVFNSYDELCNIILQGIDEGKWLIFVDNINRGKELKENLIKEKVYEESEVVFIDAKYEEDEHAYWATKDLIEKSCIKSKVVIATIVLDNGINFDDMELNNIAIIQDSKTELIQSLGRKRISNGEAINLYLLKGSRLKFEKRLQSAEEHIKLISEFSKYEPEIGTAKMLEKIFNYESIYKCAKQFLYYNRDKRNLEISFLARIRWANAVKNYKRILSYFDMYGDEGFIRIQEQLLDIDADSAIVDYYISSKQQLMNKVCMKIDEVVDKEMTTAQAIDFKEEYRKDLLTLFEMYCKEVGKSEEHSPILNNLVKSKDNFTKDMFNIVMTSLGLSYYMEERHGRGNTKFFTIRKK